jgi:hypothetical protein
MSQCHEGKRFLYPGFVFKHISFQERWGVSRQGDISRNITNIPNKFIKSHVSKKKGNSEKGAVFSRKVGTFRERSETLEKSGFYINRCFLQIPGLLAQSPNALGKHGDFSTDRYFSQRGGDFFGHSNLGLENLAQPFSFFSHNESKALSKRCELCQVFLTLCGSELL